MNNNVTPYLSIIIPSYKSAQPLDKNLPVLLDFLYQKDFTWEVVIVDDGSNDNASTKTIAKKYNCQYLENPKNMGKGMALRNGMLNSYGRFKIFTDADVPYRTEVLEQIIKYLDFKEFDMVVGDRTLQESSYFENISPIRNLGSRIFSSIIGKFITTGVYDTQCGIKGFRSEVANDLFSSSRVNGFTIDVELFYIAFKRNYDIKRIPVQLRSTDGSSVNVIKHGIMMLLDIPFIISNYYRGKYKKQVFQKSEKVNSI